MTHKLKKGKKLIERPLNQGLPCANLFNIWEVWHLPTQLCRLTFWWYNGDVVVVMWWCSAELGIIWGMCDPLLLRRLMMPCCANWWHAASDSELQKPLSGWAIYIISTPFTNKMALKDDKGHFEFSLIYQIIPVSIGAHGQCITQSGAWKAFPRCNWIIMSIASEKGIDLD